MKTSCEPVQILVLQSTAFCNIDCSYCYLPDRDVKGRMGRDVLQRVGREIIDSPYWRDDSLVLWHAGEPLVCGVEWYRYAHSLLSDDGRRPLRIQFQTNGTLLDSAWTDFFRESGACVGVSIDGPKVLHDHHRRDRRGKPTFDRCMQSISMLRDAAIPFSTISVVTSESLGRADEIFEFFNELEPSRVGFSIEEAEGVNCESSLYRDSLLELVERFFFSLAMRNFQAAKPLRIREIDAVLAALVESRVRVGTSQEVELGWIVAIGTGGDVALFSPELLTTRSRNGQIMTVGDIRTQSFTEIVSSEKARHQAEQILRGVSACRFSCEYFPHCGGGSPANKYFEFERFDVAETWYCRVAKKATVRGILRAIAETAR